MSFHRSAAHVSDACCSWYCWSNSNKRMCCRHFWCVGLRYSPAGKTMGSLAGRFWPFAHPRAHLIDRFRLALCTSNMHSVKPCAAASRVLCINLDLCTVAAGLVQRADAAARPHSPSRRSDAPGELGAAAGGHPGCHVEGRCSDDLLISDLLIDECRSMARRTVSRSELSMVALVLKLLISLGYLAFVLVLKLLISLAMLSFSLSSY